MKSVTSIDPKIHQHKPSLLRQKYPGEALVRLHRDALVVLQDMAALGDCSVLKIAGFKLYLLNHPDFFREVLITQNDAFIKGRAAQFLGILLGQGLLNSEGTFHHKQRKLVLPAFHHHKIAGYATDMAESAAHLSQQWQQGQTLMIDDAMMDVTLDIVAKTLFGADVSSDKDVIKDALAEGQEVFRGITNPFASLILRLPFPITRKIQRVVHRMDTIIYRIIESHRAAPDQYTDLLSLLLASRDEETGAGMSDKQLRDETMTLFTAGHETTAVALTWTWFLLAQYPEIERKLHAELDAVLGGRLPTFEDIPRLVYTRQVFSEVLRLYPPAWAITRQALQDIQIGPYAIPKGATIDLSAYLLHRDDRFWPNPEVFDPERFSPQNRKSIDKFTFLPFSIGIRGCIGEQFAWMEGIIVLATLAQQWRFKLLSTTAPGLNPLITLRPATPIKVQAIKRNEP